MGAAQAGAVMGTYLRITRAYMQSNPNKNVLSDRLLQTTHMKLFCLRDNVRLHALVELESDGCSAQHLAPCRPSTALPQSAGLHSGQHARASLNNTDLQSCLTGAACALQQHLRRLWQPPSHPSRWRPRLQRQLRSPGTGRSWGRPQHAFQQ